MSPHKPEPPEDGSPYCRHCGRGINVVRERSFTEAERIAANRYGAVLTWRHNPGPGYAHPRRSKP